MNASILLLLLSGVHHFLSGISSCKMLHYVHQLVANYVRVWSHLRVNQTRKVVGHKTKTITL